MKETDCRKCCVCAFKDGLCKEDFCEKYYREGSAEDFEKLISHWIPCSEGLPEKYDMYLCCFEDGDLYTEWLEDAQWARDIVKRDKIIAWMPLPEPYKAERQEE